MGANEMCSRCFRTAISTQRPEAHTYDRFQRLEMHTNEPFTEVNHPIAERAAETIDWLVGMSVVQAGLIITVPKLHG